MLKNGVIVILGGVLGYFILLRPFVINPAKLNKNHRFTIGTVFKKRAPANGDVDAIVYFYVNGTQYDGAIGVGNFDHEVYVGDRYIVKFYPPDPNISRVITTSRVESKLEAPPEGWDYMP